MIERLVLGMTNEGDLVVDPYVGVGTTCIAALTHNRRSAGADTYAYYLAIARRRVMKAQVGTLPMRPLNKPIHIPDPNSKLVQLPKEWREQ